LYREGEADRAAAGGFVTYARDHLLQKAGHHGLAVLAGGAGDWADATGQPLREGP
jgi:hypothetical protein